MKKICACKCLICHKTMELEESAKADSVFIINDKNVIWSDTDLECIVCSKCSEIRQNIKDNSISIIYGVDSGTINTNSNRIRIRAGVVLHANHMYPSGIIFTDDASVHNILKTIKQN